MSDRVYANPEALVSGDWLEEHLNDPAVRVVEVDVSPKSYGEGHIPGAVFWDIYKALKTPAYELVGAPAFETVLRASGIEPSTKVVFYGYGPVFGYWLLELYGHANASVLNLSKRRWHEDGRPWNTSPADWAASRYTLPEPKPGLRVRQPAVAESIEDANCVILDVRSEAEFRGERFWPSGALEEKGRAGHIPGALHVALDAVMDGDGVFAPPEVLDAIFPERLDKVRNVITYCTIGNRASVAWFVLSELLGRREVTVYDGSWAEWGFLTDAAVATGS